MVVDVVVEMDDIDMMLARIEMARDKLTTARIARSAVHAKAKSKMGLRFRERVNAAQFEGETGRRDRVKTPHSTATVKTVAR
jgi:hypothetical protein